MEHASNPPAWCLACGETYPSRYPVTIGESIIGCKSCGVAYTQQELRELMKRDENLIPFESLSLEAAETGVKAILEKHFHIQPEQAVPAALLSELGLDVDDIARLLQICEQEFEVSCYSGFENEHMKKVSDVIRLIRLVAASSNRLKAIRASRREVSAS